MSDAASRRDLTVTTDFRALFGEVLVRHLGLPLAAASQIFPGYDIASHRFPARSSDDLPRDPPRARAPASRVTVSS